MERDPGLVEGISWNSPEGTEEKPRKFRLRTADGVPEIRIE
jgi:hypothetical protein